VADEAVTDGAQGSGHGDFDSKEKEFEVGLADMMRLLVVEEGTAGVEACASYVEDSACMGSLHTYVADVGMDVRSGELEDTCVVVMDEHGLMAAAYPDEVHEIAEKYAAAAHEVDYKDSDEMAGMMDKVERSSQQVRSVEEAEAEELDVHSAAGRSFVAKASLAPAEQLPEHEDDSS
jgi:hypothetical protein